MQVDLSASTVLVTGATGRLGRVLTQELIASGATVVGADVAGEPASDGLFVTCDVTQEADVERLFAEAGAVDAVIHLVGTWAGGALAETSLDAFDALMRTNLISTFLVFREAARVWRNEGARGRLVAIASRQGADLGAAEQPGYSAAKAGVMRLVEATTAELASAGITAAAVAPSMILYGDEGEDVQGVPALQVAKMCAYLASEVGGAAHAGTVMRAYGNAI